VTAAWLTITLLVLGVPLAAWWLGGRRFWARHDARAAGDPAAEIMRRHGLTTKEATQVVSAVPAGRELADPRMRAAAVELAELTLEQVLPRWHEASVGRRIVIAFSAVWVVVVLAGSVFVAVFEGLGEVSWFHLAGAAVVVGSPLWQSRKLRQTIALNSGPAPAAGE
jgi:hypothetical protein